MEEVIGDPNDLLFVPLDMCEESSSSEMDGYGRETLTWYKFRTIKGDVTVRWLGTSNGYYSEEVSHWAGEYNPSTPDALVEWDELLEKSVVR